MHIQPGVVINANAQEIGRVLLPGICIFGRRREKILASPSLPYRLIPIGAPTESKWDKVGDVRVGKRAYIFNSYYTLPVLFPTRVPPQAAATVVVVLFSSLGGVD